MKLKIIFLASVIFIFFTLYFNIFLIVIFDPASFYGHHEFDLAIAKMFGGFGQSLFSAYHSIIPKSPGFDGRIEIYKLFHYLNHW